MVDITPQDASAGGVERGDERRVAAAEQLLDTLGHLACRLVGEGDRHDVPGAHPPLADQVGDAVGDDPGLARAGSGQDEERSLAVQHGRFLGRVQVGEEAHRVLFFLLVIVPTMEHPVIFWCLFGDV